MPATSPTPHVHDLSTFTKWTLTELAGFDCALLFNDVPIIDKGPHGTSVEVRRCPCGHTRVVLEHVEPED